MKILISLLLIILIPANSFARNLSTTKEEAVHLMKDEAAPFDGVLLPPGMADKQKNDLINADYNKALAESLTKSVDLYKANEELYQKKVTLYLDQNDKLAQRLGESQSMNTWEHVFYFALGVIATCSAGYAITRVK